MSVYVIFRVASPERVEAALAEHYPGKHLKLRDGQYLVSGTGTAQTVSDTLDTSQGSIGSAMIFRMSSYYGRASSDIWDWIQSEAEAASG